MLKKNILCMLFVVAAARVLAQQPGSSLRLYFGMEAANIVRPLEFREQGILKALSIRDVTEARPVLALAYMHTLKTGRYFEAGIRYDGPIDGNRAFISRNIFASILDTPLVNYANRTMQLHLETGRGFKVIGRKLKPYLGGFLRYSVNNFDMKSQDPAFFSEERRYYDIQFGLTPRFSLPLGKRFDLNVSMPVQLFQMRFDYSKIDNPALTPAQQENTTFDFGALYPLAQFRVGLGWQLNKPAADE
ncbi:MAG: hypothetical protein J0L99_07330 [Chitinophagales bacterium]|nr:hypothetical protein [Chitinophagales bacterium]